MEVIVLKEGVHKREESRGNYSYMIKPICSSVTLIKDESKNILVDTGYYSFAEEIISKLAEHGLKPEDIDYIINTHEHFDHCANNHLFGNAKKLVGILEWNPDGTINIYKSLKDIKIIEGLEIIETPGHKVPHYSVIARSDKTYVIAGDTISKEFFVASFENKKQKINSAKQILDIADVIIPGHGPIINKEDFGELRQKIDEIEKKTFGGI